METILQDAIQKRKQLETEIEVQDGIIKRCKWIMNNIFLDVLLSICGINYDAIGIILQYADINFCEIHNTYFPIDLPNCFQCFTLTTSRFMDEKNWIFFQTKAEIKIRRRTQKVQKLVFTQDDFTLYLHLKLFVSNLKVLHLFPQSFYKFMFFGFTKYNNVYYLATSETKWQHNFPFYCFYPGNFHSVVLTLQNM